MDRRSFLKLMGISPFVPSLLISKKLRPTKQDEVFAELVKIGDYGSCSGPFIKFNGIWYFSDENKIMWCPENELHSDNWRKIHLENYDKFDFWQHSEGKLYWAGQRERWEIEAEAVGFNITLRFDAYFDN